MTTRDGAMRLPEREHGRPAGALTRATAGWVARVAVILVACGPPLAFARGRLPAAARAASDRAGAAAVPPATIAAGPLAPSAPLSRVTVPIDYDVTAVIAVVEHAVPRTFGSLDSLHQAGTDASKHYAYVATRSPFVASFVGGEVHLRTTLAYAARGYYRTPLGPTLRAGCGAGGDPARRPRLVVELVTPLALGANWHFRSAARVASVTPASAGSADACRVSLINLDVTGRVVDAARQDLTAQLPDIDRKIAAVDLTPQATDWWRALNRPIHLADSVWLLIGPETLRVGHIGGTGHIATVEAGLDGHPRIVSGPEPREPVPPLPRLAASVGVGLSGIGPNGPARYSAIASRFSSSVFMRNGPPNATGSPTGRPE